MLLIVTWIVSASLVLYFATLRLNSWSSEYLASSGVLELVIGLRIVPNNMCVAIVFLHVTYVLLQDVLPCKLQFMITTHPDATNSKALIG